VAKNKGTMGKNKRAAAALAQPDEFVSTGSKIIESLKPHAMKLFVGGALLALAIVAFAIWNWNHGRQAAKATAIYHRALVLEEVPVVENPAPKDGPATDLRGVPGSFPDATTRANAVLAALDELARDHGGTSADRQARLLRGGVLLSLGRPDEAATAYRDFASDTDTPILRVSALEGYGYALEAKAAAEKDARARQAGLELALAAFTDMQPSETGPGRGRALYHQGRILSVLGRHDDARKRYEAALAVADLGLKAEIEDRLGSLNRSATGGGSAAAPAAPTPAAPAAAAAAPSPATPSTAPATPPAPPAKPGTP
jgi:hypothetical protein